MNNDFVLGDVALFIDWENFKISLAGGNRVPNVSALKEEVSNHGRVVVAKAYADWVTRSPELNGASQFVNDPPALYASGIEPVYVPTRLQLGNSNNSNRTITVKNKRKAPIEMGYGTENGLTGIKKESAMRRGSSVMANYMAYITGTTITGKNSNRKLLKMVFAMVKAHNFMKMVGNRLKVNMWKENDLVYGHSIMRIEL